MARDWFLVASLAKLRDEFNQLAPNRDKASDGSIGDRAHAAGGNSDHLPDEEFDALRDHDADDKNEVHAIDVDVDLKQPGVSMEKVVQFLLARCRAGQETRLKYIIFNRRIWSASNSWRQKAYTGANPHDHHAHFSGKYDSASESSVRSWHLEDLEDDMAALTEAETRTVVREEIERAMKLDPIAAINARTDFLQNRWRPTVDTRLADLAAKSPEVELSSEDVAELAGQVVDGMDDAFANALLDKLKGRLEA